MVIVVQCDKPNVDTTHSYSELFKQNLVLKTEAWTHPTQVSRRVELLNK